MIYTVYSSLNKVDFDTYYNSSIELILSNDFGANQIKYFFNNLSERNEWNLFYDKILKNNNFFQQLAYRSKHPYCLGWFISNIILNQEEIFFQFLETNNISDCFFDLLMDLEIFNRFLKIMIVKVGMPDQDEKNYLLINPIDLFLNCITNNQKLKLKEICLRNKFIYIINNTYNKISIKDIKNFSELQSLRQSIDLIISFSKFIDLKNVEYNSIVNNLEESFNLMDSTIKTETDKLFIKQNNEIISNALGKTKQEIENIYQTIDIEYHNKYIEIYSKNCVNFEKQFKEQLSCLINIYDKSR